MLVTSLVLHISRRYKPWLCSQQSFNESLKIKWIKGYLDDNNKGKWKSFVNHYLEKHGGKLVFSANLKRQDTPLLNISDPFLAETVEYWSTLNYSEDNLNFPSSQIWLNSLIRIETSTWAGCNAGYCAISEKCCSVDGGRGICCLFSSPPPGNLLSNS